MIVSLITLLLTSLAVPVDDQGPKPPQLSGTIVDTSGAVVAGATVQVLTADGASLLRAHSDANGSFIMSGLSAGNYRLVVSDPGFETKEVSVTVGVSEAPALLRISLAVGLVSSTVNVQGREDDLTGLADSATQGTVGAKEIQQRPILRSGEVLETIPGVIITQHAGGGKANQYFLRGFNLDHGTDFAVFIDDMPLNCPPCARRRLRGHECRDPGTGAAGQLRERTLLRRRRQLRLSRIGPSGILQNAAREFLPVGRRNEWLWARSIRCIAEAR